MKPYTYIASGPSFLTFNQKRWDQSTADVIGPMITSVVQNQHSHTFGMLFNAYIEQGYGPKIQMLRPYLSEVHADSGGLQVVTQGIPVTSELKLGVYDCQGKYADVGMSFDEIPIKTASGGTSGKTETKNRYFDRDNFEQQAKLTGQNVLAQIEHYEKIGSECKAYPVIHGNCMSTYQRWSEIILQQVPKSLHPRIGGVAMGSAALGMGTLEDIKRAFYIRQLPFDQSNIHMHVLGVGSLKRMLPYMLFTQSGYYDGLSLSYDSTTHTMGVERGMYYEDGKMKGLGRLLNHNYHETYERLLALYPAWKEWCPDTETFHKIMNHSVTAWMDKHEGDPNAALLTRWLFVMASIKRFMMDVEELATQKVALDKYCRRKGFAQEVLPLYTVKTVEDFEYWERHLGCHLDSASVRSSAPNTLENLFA